MSGGQRRILINERERAKSIDQRREVAIAQRGQAELLRFLINLVGGSYEAGAQFSSTNIPAVVGTPLRADIFEGLTVEPLVGTTSVAINPGVVGMQDPDGQAGSSDSALPNADDSDYKIVIDQGESTLGVLVIAPNAGPGSRIDVVECQRRPSIAIETASRQVFDTSTGSYASQIVNKVLEGQLAYQVRQGVAGAGYPGNRLGWLPLAVAHIPAGGGATTDDVTFWDVRPVVADRYNAPHRSAWGYSPAYEMQQLYGDIVTAANETRISGYVWASINGVRAGGKMSRGIPGADQSYIDGQDVDWHEPGFISAAGDLFYLYLAFPFGLPRWCRYNSTPAPRRLPDGLRGIPLISDKQPDTQAHELQGSVVTMPLSTGLDPSSLSPTSDATCVLSAICSGVSIPGAFVAGGQWVELEEGAALPIVSPPSNGTGNPVDQYNLVPGAHFPSDARAIRVTFFAQFTGVAGNDYTLNARVGALHPGGATVVTVSGVSRMPHRLIGAGISQIELTFEIERPPEVAVSNKFDVQIDWNASGTTGKGSEKLEVIGWRMVG